MDPTNQIQVKYLCSLDGFVEFNTKEYWIEQTISKYNISRLDIDLGISKKYETIGDSVNNKLLEYLIHE